MSNKDSYFSISLEETLLALDSRKEGLSHDEALRRRREYGYNLLLRRRWIYNGEFLSGLITSRAKVRRQGRVMQCGSRDLVPGDVLLLEPRDKVPADARLLEVSNLKIDESSFTGETMPVEKRTEKISPEAALFERMNMVFMGTTVSSGRATAVVTATGMHTELGRIAGSIVRSKAKRLPPGKRCSQTGNAIMILIAASGALAVVSGALRGANLSGTMAGAAAVVLPAMLVWLRRLPSTAEKMAAVSVICADKTGVFTSNRMTVKRMFAGGRSFEVSGTGFETKGEFCIDGQPADIRHELPLISALRIAALCNDALLMAANGDTAIAGDPTEGALVVAAAKAGLSKEKLEDTFPRLGEIPFQSEKQYMATLHRQGSMRVAYLKGSVEKVLSFCAFVQMPEGVVELNEARRQEIACAYTLMAQEAMRVLAFAYVEYPVEFGTLKKENLKGKAVLAGLAAMDNPVRPDTLPALAQCRQAGIRVLMTTGDSKWTATVLAERLGLVPAKACTGNELMQLNDESLWEAIDRIGACARLEPLRKVRIVEALQRKGHVVAVTGDGVNDALALERAEVGIAAGRNCAELAKEAADIVLPDESFAAVVSVLLQSRTLCLRSRRAAFLLMGVFLAEALGLCAAAVFAWQVPVSPWQLTWTNLLSIGVLAAALGLTPEARTLRIREAGR